MGVGRSRPIGGPISPAMVLTRAAAIRTSLLESPEEGSPCGKKDTCEETTPLLPLDIVMCAGDVVSTALTL